MGSSTAAWVVVQSIEECIIRSVLFQDKGESVDELEMNNWINWHN